MSIILNPELEADVRSRVSSGRYADPMDVLNEAMRLLDERERRIAYDAAIQEALTQVERGEYIVVTKDTMRQLIEEADREEAMGLPLCEDVLRELRYSNRALIDIRGILRYTRRTWGEAQRETFSDELTLMFYRLCEFPMLGHMNSRSQGEVRSFPFSVYNISYVVNENNVTILRVQHQRMNPPIATDS